MGQLTNIIIAMILFSGVTLWISNFYGELGVNYDVEANGTGYLNRSIELAQAINETQGKYNPPSSDQLSGFIVFDAIGALFDLGGKTIGTFSGIAEDATVPAQSAGVPIPPEFIAIMTLVVTTLVVMLFLSFWRQYEA